jgi:hypothetical protein
MFDFPWVWPTAQKKKCIGTFVMLLPVGAYKQDIETAQASSSRDVCLLVEFELII